MLSNLAINQQQKFVLFVDEVGLERYSTTIIENLLNEQNEKYSHITDEQFADPSKELPDKGSVILPSFSMICLDHPLEEIFNNIWLLNQTSNIRQIFGWLTVKNIKDQLLRPFLEHTSDAVITLKTDKLMSMLLKKNSGSIRLKDYTYQIQLDNKSFSIKEYKQEKPQKSEVLQVNPETIGTFKIGQFDAAELKAKKSLQLPYEK